MAATHLVPKTFDPRTSDPPLPVPLDKWSQKNWSPWTNAPHGIRSLWTNGPQPIWSPNFWIPTTCPPGQMEYSRDHLSRGTKLVGDHLSMGIKFLGTVCPEGPINWGPIVGEQMSGDHMRSGPNVSQSKYISTFFMPKLLTEPIQIAKLRFLR